MREKFDGAVLANICAALGAVKLLREEFEMQHRFPLLLLGRRVSE